MDKTKMCCIIGQRVPTGQRERIKEELSNLVEQAIHDGFTWFLAGMDEEVDKLFLQVYLEKKAKHPEIRLEAVRSSYNGKELPEDIFQYLDGGISFIRPETEGEEENKKLAYVRRNLKMLGMSERVIAVYDGSQCSRTGYAIDCAKIMKLDLKIIKAQGKE